MEEEGELIGEEIATLKVANVSIDNEKIAIKYEYKFEMEGEKEIQTLNLRITVGQMDDNLVFCFNNEGGNRLFYKKAVKDIKYLYANCLT